MNINFKVIIMSLSLAKESRYAVVAIQFDTNEQGNPDEYQALADAVSSLISEGYVPCAGSSSSTTAENRENNYDATHIVQTLWLPDWFLRD